MNSKKESYLVKEWDIKHLRDTIVDYSVINSMTI